MLRVFGIAAVFFSCTAIGLRMSAELSQRAGCLRELEKLALMLEGEIRYAKTPLGEALAEVAGRAEQPFRQFFLETARTMELRDGQNMADIFQTCADAALKGSGLLDKDIRQLARMGGRLGYLDREMQVQTLLLYREELRRERSEAESDCRQKGRVYRCMGFFCGCFLILLLA